MLAETQFLIYLSQQGGTILKARSRKLEWLGTIPGDESGPTTLSNILLKQHTHPVLLMIDSVDEDYRLETLPHVSGKARQEMLDRRLRQTYRGQPFCAAWKQRRETTGRKDDRYLLAALNDSDWLTPWLSTISSLGFPLAGVSLVSSGAQALMTKLKFRDPQLLLVSRQSAGLRFSYFQQGQLRFSRLTPGEKGELNCADEVSRTLLYLSSQRIVPRDARCTILILDLERNQAPALASLNADPLFDARQLSVEQLAQALRVSAEFIKATPGVALLAAQAGLPSILNLAPAKLTQAYQLHRTRRLISATALACLTVGTAVSAAQWFQASQYKIQAENLTQELARNESLYQETLKQYPLVSIPPDMLRQSIQISNTLESHSHNPESSFAVLSRALDQHPQVILQSLTWSDKLSTSSGQADHLEARALIDPFDGNYRVAVDQIKSFLATLTAQPGASHVTLIEGPVSAESSTPLSGSTLGNKSPGDARFRFSLDYTEGKP